MLCQSKTVPLPEIHAAFETGVYPDVLNLFGLLAEVPYVGSQLQFAGLDQVNIRLPKALAGRSTFKLHLWFDNPEYYRESNMVEVRLGGVRTN